MYREMPMNRHRCGGNRTYRSPVRYALLSNNAYAVRLETAPTGPDKSGRAGPGRSLKTVQGMDVAPYVSSTVRAK